MKSLLLTTAFLTALLLIGCQENSITDPVSMDPVNKSQNQGTTVTQGTFSLEGTLSNPGNGSNSTFAISGSIDYIHELVLLDPIPPAPQNYVDLKLALNAVLIDTDFPGNSTWIISAESVDMLYVSEEGMYLLEKSYPVQGRADGLALVCRFLVTTEGVGFSSMWLTINSDIKLNKAHTQPDTVTYPPVRIDVWD